MSRSPVGSDRKRFLSLINDAHDRSGRSLREVGDFCGIDHAYISRILKGERLSNRDIILALCLFGWNLDGYDIEDILKAGGYKTILNWKKMHWEDESTEFNTRPRYSTN